MGLIAQFLESRLLWLALGCTMLFVAGQRAMEGLARDPRFLAEPRWDNARGPAWGGDAVLVPVLERLERLGAVNLFDPRFEAKVRGALEEVPGVAAVRRIRRRWPNRYTVQLRLRRPVALVVGEGGLVPVTRGAVALPGEPYSRAAMRLVRIAGVGATRAPEPGERWEDRDLAEGLATLEQLAPYLRELAPLGIHTIDVAGAFDPRRGVVLRGADGIVVRWGRSRATVGENPVEKKVEYLRVAAGHLDRVRGFEIDIRYGTLFLRESPS